MTRSNRTGERTEWRAWGESWLAALIPGLVALGGILTAYQGFTYPGGWFPLGGVVGVFGVIMALAGAFFVVVLVRTRTRLIADGIEIRQIGAEVIGWKEIASVQLDRSNADRTITVSLRDGRTRTLPTPTQAKRPLSDPTLPDAVAAMRRRL